MGNRYLVVLTLLCVSMGSIAFAGSTDNSKSIFTDPDDTGGADGVNLVDTKTQQKDAFVNVVKGAVNRVLGILALIALLVVMYGGFQMVTSAGNEESYTKGFTILKYAAIGLVLIGVAWFIVSGIFWLVNKTASGAGSGAGTGG